ncbi:MAG TPA: peptidyl-prolyl cis-trans isomerase, partial [Rhizobiaceae bacterium]|nr:peptidyl-prolyl cis-trans isomerase [Rhizobiaceae bacterium]
PDEATLKTWYDANKKSFDAPEYRSISFVQLTAKAIADPAAISDASISEDYEKNKERYRTPEQRHIEQLVFPDREAAQAALDLIRAGGGFEEAVTDAGKTMSDVDLGMMARGAVANPAIGDAAFALQQGAVSDIVDGPFGPVLLRVTEIRPEAIKPFEEVKDEIRNDLALVEANDLLLETHDSYEDARAGGESMKEAAARLKLPFATVESVDRRGLRPDESIVSDLPESATLLANAFEADAGVENVPMNIREGGFLWYEVDAITPSRERPLDEVRQKAVDTWRKQETDRLLREKAEALLKELRDGKPLADLAASVNLAVETKYGLQRNGEDPDFGPGGAMAVFSGGPSHKGLAQSADGERQLLFQVTESAEPAGLGPDSIPESQRRQIGAAVADDLLDQLVTRLQQEYPVLINQAAIERALQF